MLRSTFNRCPAGYTHPKIANIENHKTPLWQAARGVCYKYKRYVDNFHIPKEQVKPLVFENFGGWAPETVDLLQQSLRAVRNGDDVIFSKLWRELRNRIAVTIAKGHAAVIHCHNARQRAALRRTTLGFPHTSFLEYYIRRQEQQDREAADTSGSQ